MPPSLENAPAFPAALAGRYELLGVLGAGGFGAVFHARDKDLDREVAIKVLRRPQDPRGARRFRHEAQALARLDHPGVVRVHGFGETPEGPYLEMEYLAGVPLQEDADAVQVMLAVADALNAVHQAGLLHRDVKPSNLVRTAAGRVVLVDFGLVLAEGQTRATDTGSLVGSLPYLAPELLRGHDPTPASDWFAWGVSLFELLERRRPFASPPAGLMPGDAAPLVFRRVAPDSGAAALLRAAMDPDPDRRPANPAEARRWLVQPASVAASASATSPRPPVPGRAGRRGPALLALALLGAAATATWRVSSPASPPPALATSEGTPEPGRQAEVRGQLLQVVQQLREPHRVPGRGLHPGRGPSPQHLDDVLEEYRDGRNVTRLRRLFRGLGMVADGGPLPPVTRALLLDEVTPLLIHLAHDEASAQADLVSPQKGYGTADHQLLRDRLGELRAVRHEFQDLAWRVPGLPGAELAQYLFWDRGYAEERDRVDRLVAQLEQAPTPEERLRYASVVAHFLASDLWSDKSIDCAAREAILGVLEGELRGDLASGLGPVPARFLGRVTLVVYHQLVACRNELRPEDLERLELLLADFAVRIGRGQPHALTAAASFLVGVVQHFETGGGLMVRDPRLVELVVRARALVVEARRKAGMPPIPGHFLDGTGLGAIGRF